jgi:LPS O-antigen subunit length determinant protein (WzzB/FepE family)
MIAFKKEPEATKYNNLTISLSAHTAKRVAAILRRRIEKKIEDILGKDQSGFRKGKNLGLQLGC